MVGDKKAVSRGDVEAENWPAILVDFYRAHCINGLEGQEGRGVGLSEEAAKLVFVLRGQPLSLDAFEIKVHTNLTARGQQTDNSERQALLISVVHIQILFLAHHEILSLGLFPNHKHVSD
ncbi:hypothetical protein HG531_003089 [Fusarium graminearum]|nr:hypothetical protein HG531_003089 [Fusarium graminearum]